MHRLDTPGLAPTGWILIKQVNVGYSLHGASVFINEILIQGLHEGTKSEKR